MSDEKIPEGAFKTLNEIRARDFADIPEDLLRSIFELESAAQFEAERGPTVAKLRKLILDEDEA